jgi:hypothetical protein
LRISAYLILIVILLSGTLFDIGCGDAGISGTNIEISITNHNNQPNSGFSVDDSGNDLGSTRPNKRPTIHINYFANIVFNLTDYT